MKFHFQIAILLVLTSCTLYRPVDKNPMPELPVKYELYTKGQVAPGKWWKAMQSKQLNILIEEALRKNVTILEKTAAVQKARAVAIKSGSPTFPGVSYRADASTSRKNSQKGRKNLIQSYGMGLMASYEIDFWGRIASLQKTSQYKFKSSAEDLFASAMSISGDVAETWLKLIAIEQKLKLMGKQLKTVKIIQEITELKYKRGLSSALDVFQQRQNGASIETQIPLYEKERSSLFLRLSILLGRTPRDNFIEVSEKFPALSKVPATGIPADLLSMRPDIRKAGYDLKAAQWYVSSAKTDRLPTIRLTASYSFKSNEAPNLFDNWIANLASGITGPIFNGGYKKAEVMRAKFEAEEKLMAYKKKVLNAIQEVQTALIVEKKQKEYIMALEKQYEFSSIANREALEFYRRGATDYINVLNSLKSKQRLEISRVDARLNLYLNRISLHRSLGGTWMIDQYEIKENYRRAEK